MLASPQIAWKEVDETQAHPTVGQIHVALQGLLKNRDKQGVRSATPVVYLHPLKTRSAPPRRVSSCDPSNSTETNRQSPATVAKNFLLPPSLGLCNHSRLSTPPGLSWAYDRKHSIPMRSWYLLLTNLVSLPCGVMVILTSTYVESFQVA